MDVAFITDTHIKMSSNVRTGDYLEDCAIKLEWVVDYCNKNNCILLHGGDLFDKPSVPDTVKNRIIPVLRKLHNPMYSIPGNHDLLFNSADYKYKTSYQTLVEAGLFIDLDNTTVDLGNFVITNELPVIQRNKPQIVVYHGFLNQEDGRWTFRFDDIKPAVTDQLYICLGHDHVEYENLKFNDHTKIIRPGSFMRVTREDASYRSPKLVHIKFKDGHLYSKTLPIEASRPAEEVFTAKLAMVTKAQQHDTYEAIISQIKNANTKNMSFREALSIVSTESVCNYVFRSLEQSRLNKQYSNKNL